MRRSLLVVEFAFSGRMPWTPIGEVFRVDPPAVMDGLRSVLDGEADPCAALDRCGPFPALPSVTLLHSSLRAMKSVGAEVRTVFHDVH